MNGIARTCRVYNLGTVEYQRALDLQCRLADARLRGDIPDIVLLLDHPAVYTIGRFGREENILLTRDALRQRGVQVVRVDRGGDVTFHGPGQLVGYPIMDLRAAGMSVRRYVACLEETLIRTLADFSVVAHRDPQFPGVWVGANKIGALGVRVSRYVTRHGFALNINTDLSYFNNIVPCGIKDRGITSISHELGQEVKVDSVIQVVIRSLAEVFASRMVVGDCSELAYRESIDPIKAL